MQGKNVLQFPESSASRTSLPTPFYDLLGDRICVGLHVRHSGQRLQFFVHLRPPTDAASIEVLRQRDIIFKPAKGAQGQDIDRAGLLQEDRQFFDDHLIAAVYNKKELTPSELDQIDPMFKLKINAVTFLIAVTTPPIEEVQIGEMSAIPSIEELLSTRPMVPQALALASDEGKEFSFQALQKFAMPSAADSLTYARVQKIRTFEGGAQSLITNYSLVTKLYDSLIDSADGFMLGAARCERSNKAEWVPKIPFVFKWHAVRELFRDAERKNA
jgi:hypothetical protein